MIRTLVIPALLLAACAPSGPAPASEAIVLPDAEHVALAETLVPDDPALAAIYDRSCRTCHALDGLGAPMTGHSEAWDVRRVARTDDGLLASVKQGRGTMPALGYCADCSDADFAALIAFMSTEGTE
ncbi:MAG: cytochrome c5 family protein [Hyphomonas sp.]|nr:cytochrome c5 family protein [Hyphomonas sp.]